jgi:hypothetical protein
LSAARRVSGGEKDKRDLLMYWVWQSGLLTNAQVGNLYGLTYSAVSHNVTEIQKKLRTDKGLRTLIRQLNSQFKLCQFAPICTENRGGHHGNKPRIV